MSTTSYLSRPVFITGFNKSGTTLLLSLFDYHPQLMVFPEELHFCRNVLFARDPVGALRDKTGFRMFLSDDYLAEWSQGKSWNQGGYPNFDRVRFGRLVTEAWAKSGNEPWACLFAALESYREVAAIPAEKLNCWVSKTTQNEIHYPYASEMFQGNDRWLYVVRDPRDVFASLVKRNLHAGVVDKRPEGFLQAFATSWRQQVRVALRYRASRANFRVVRYEDLLEDTAGVIRTYSDYLDVEFDRCLLEPTRCGERWGGNSVHTATFDGLSKSSLARYREVLDETTIGALEALLREEMHELGYRLDTAGISSTGNILGRVVRRLYGHIRYGVKQQWLSHRGRMVGRPALRWDGHGDAG